MTRDAEAPSITSASADAAATSPDMRELRLQRNLKIVVAVLGLMIAAGLLTVVGRIIYLASTGAKPGATKAVAATPGAPLDIPFELPAGARIVSVSIAGNRLAIHHESPAGSGIAIIDTETGAHLANVKPQVALPGK